MIYCRTSVNFFSTLNDWKSEDKLQNPGLGNSVYVLILHLSGSDISLKCATQRALSSELKAGLQIE